MFTWQLMLYYQIALRKYLITFLHHLASIPEEITLHLLTFSKLTVNASEPLEEGSSKIEKVFLLKSGV